MINLHPCSFQQFFLVILISFIFHFTAISQIAYRNYTVKDGLPSSEVYHTIQDSKGYIWFATESGVSRFDGTKFTNYTMENGLSDETILRLFEDYYKRIWFIPLTGQPCYYENGKIHAMPLPQKYKSYSSSYFFSHADSSIWFSTHGGYFELKGKKAGVYIPHPFAKENGLIYSLGIDSHDNLMGAFQRDRGYNVYYNLKTKRFGKYTDPKAVLKHLTEGKYHKAWGYLDFVKTIYDISIDSIQCKDREKEALLLKIKAFLKDQQIVFVHEDEKKNVWMASYQRGLFCFAPDFVKTGNVKQYFANTSISSMLIDREGNLWATSPAKGAMFVSNIDASNYTKVNGLFSNRILSIAKDKGGIWIGMGEGKVNFLSKDGTITGLDLHKQLGYWGRVTSIASSNKGIFLGTDNGLVLYKNNTYKILNTLRNGLQFANSIKCISQNKYGKTLFGSHASFFSIEEDFYVDDLGAMLGRYPIRTTAIYVAKDTSTWVGTEKGLLHLKGRQLIEKDGWPDIANNRIKGIGELPDGVLCIATDNKGLYLLRNKKIFHIDVKQGLSSNNCRVMFIDEKGSIWIGTNNGINKITPLSYENQQYDIKYFNTDDGLMSEEVNALLVEKDTVWAGTSEGLSVFKDQQTAPVKPLIYISKVKINKRDTVISSSYDLPFNQNNIEIEATALSYKSQGKLIYRYQLKGLDSSWNYTNYGYIRYPALATGKNYMFTVQARSSEGIWSDVAKVSLLIRSPYWQTWWFILISVVLILLFLCTLFLFLFKKIKRREEAKTALNRKLVETELKALRAQMNPHFTFNSMTAIQHYILKNDIDSAQHYLAKFSKLIRKVLDNSKSTYISIREEIETLKLYLQLESMRFENSFEYEISINHTVEQDSYYIPSMLIQPYLENAIWHGLMHKTEKGKLKLKIDKKEESIKCTIEDNGVGRKKAQEIIERSNRKHVSMGMLVTKERLDILNMFNENKLNIKIVDLENEAHYSCGTRIEINIPYKKIEF